MRLFDPSTGELREVKPAPARLLRIAAGDGVRVAIVADLLRRIADRRHWQTGVAGFSSLTDRQLLYVNVHPFQDPTDQAELVVHEVGSEPPVSGRSVPVGEVVATDDAVDPLALRLALLRLPYREPAGLDGGALAAAFDDLKRWRGLVAELAEHPSAPMASVDSVVTRIEDDLDLPGALGALETLAGDTSVSPGARFEAFVHLDRLLGLDLAAEIGRR